MKLSSYLVRLAIEPELYSEFVADPPTALEKAGLSDEDRALLLGGDQNRIYASLTGGRTGED